MTPQESQIYAEIEELEEQARVCWKWATQKADWLDNLAVQDRYKGDPGHLTRVEEEVDTMRALSARLTRRIEAMKKQAAEIPESLTKLSSSRSAV